MPTPKIAQNTTPIPKLIGWKFNYLGMEKGFICNFSKDTFALSLATVFANPMQFDQYFADTTVIVNGITSLSKYSANSSDTIIVYPYSITQINSVIATGIQNFETIKNELWIYPNPANRNINIRTEINLNNADVFIYDISGKEVIQLNKISGNSFLLSLDKLNSGVYFVKINSNNKTTTGKFIVD